MKSLREHELEYEVGKLKRRVWELEGSQIFLTGADDLDDVRTVGAHELPVVAMVRVEPKNPYDKSEGLRLLMETRGRESLGMSYHLGPEVVADDRHLEQALVTMHERLIHKIITRRREQKGN